MSWILGDLVLDVVVVVDSGVGVMEGEVEAEVVEVEVEEALIKVVP